MQATLMNYSYRHHHHQPMDDHFSPPSTPSPPMFPPRLKCRPTSYMPYFHPQKQQLYHSIPQEPRVVRKRGFSIVELLGIGGDSDREVTYKCKPYHTPIAEATPRTALTALLPQSPEKLTDKYDSKCSKPHSRKPDDGESNSIYDILSPPAKPTPKSSPTQSHGGGKMKRIRTIFTPEQLERLESEFERQQYMVGPERLYLASTLNLSESQVKIWFQNRRIKWRKQHLELQQARLAQMREGGSPGEVNNRETSSPDAQHHQQQWDE